MKREDVQKKLRVYYIDLIATVFRSAVKREAGCDLKLRDDKARCELLENAVRGVSVICLLAFLQSNLKEDEWDAIKRSGHKRRLEEDFKQFKEWDLLDGYKYVRDCFGHDHEGKMFPASDKNTQHFLTIYQKGVLKGVRVENDCLVLDREISHAVFMLVRALIEVAEIR